MTSTCATPWLSNRASSTVRQQGTGVSARMALLHAQGLMNVGDQLHMASVINSEFVGQIESTTTVGELAAIVPLISGTAWRTGRFSFELDPDRPMATRVPSHRHLGCSVTIPRHSPLGSFHIAMWSLAGC